MRRLLPFFALLFGFGFGCTGAATTTGFTPVTSVLVRGESIIPAAQCGMGASQYAKYTSVITQLVTPPAGSGAAPTTTTLGGQTTPCFADAMFANLPAIVSYQTYRVDVFLWSAASYASAPNIASIEARLRDPSPDVVAGALAELQKLGATSRTCTAYAVNSVQSVAQCDPPKPADAGSDSASEAGSDSGSEAGSDSGIADGGSG